MGSQGSGSTSGSPVGFVPDDFAEWDPDAAKSHADLEKDKTKP